jgi:hypothetical protein
VPKALSAIMVAAKLKYDLCMFAFPNLALQKLMG